MKWNKLLVLLLMGAFALISSAQGYDLPEQTENSQKIVEQASQGIDYSDEYIAKPKAKERSQKEDEDNLFKESQPFSFPSIGKTSMLVIQVLAIALLCFLIIFIIYQIIKSQKKVKNKKYDELSLDFAKKDLGTKLSQELGKGDYRLACRTLFLQLLQEFVNRRLILWRNEKTNWDYYQETHKKIGEKDPELKAVTMAYDQLWYGEKEPSLDEFNHFKYQINQLLNG